MTIDLNPNLVLSSVLKKSASFFSIDSQKLAEIIQNENKSMSDKGRFTDRRNNPRINSGRRRIDLINYF